MLRVNHGDETDRESTHGTCILASSFILRYVGIPVYGCCRFFFVMYTVVLQSALVCYKISSCFPSVVVVVVVYARCDSSSYCSTTPEVRAPCHLCVPVDHSTICLTILIDVHHRNRRQAGGLVAHESVATSQTV